MIARPGGSTACQSAKVPDWHVRWRPSPEPQAYRGHDARLTTPSAYEFLFAVELHGHPCVFSTQKERVMGLGRGALFWLLGVPLPIIILLLLFWR
jgi:hypothetical protein